MPEGHMEVRSVVDGHTSESLPTASLVTDCQRVNNSIKSEKYVRTREPWGFKARIVESTWETKPLLVFLKPHGVSKYIDEVSPGFYKNSLVKALKGNELDLCSEGDIVMSSPDPR